MGTFGFSFIGLVFLCCLFIPNILYALHPPKDPVKFRENRILWAFEKTGQVLCTVLVLVFDDLNFRGLTPWAAWLAAAALLMLLYLACWARYFLGKYETRDFFRPVLCIPLPLATLPVTAAFLLAVYGRLLWLGIAAIILGIGHIGITAQHRAAWKRENERS